MRTRRRTGTRTRCAKSSSTSTSNSRSGASGTSRSSSGSSAGSAAPAGRPAWDISRRWSTCCSFPTSGTYAPSSRAELSSSSDGSLREQQGDQLLLRPADSALVIGGRLPRELGEDAELDLARKQRDPIRHPGERHELIAREIPSGHPFLERVLDLPHPQELRVGDLVAHLDEVLHRQVGDRVGVRLS